MSFYAIKKTRLSIAFSLVLFLSLFGGSPVAYASTVLGGDGSSVFSLRSAQANVSGVVNSLSVRVYCGLSALFFESCGIGDLAPVADDTQSEVKTPSLSIKKQSAETIRPIPAMVQKVVETVARPVGIDNVFKDFVNARIAEMASELRSEMSAQVTVVQTRTRSEGDSFLSRQIDRIYDDTNESLSDAIANLNDFSEEEVMAFVSNRVALGTEGYVLQATATGTNWVATSTLGFTVAASTQWQDSGSDIYFSTGSVGIGTSTVASKLTVSGGQITADYGSVSAPTYSFISAPDTGMYASAGVLGFAVAGSPVLEMTDTRITPLVELSLDLDGSAATPAINWGSRTSDSNTGIYSPASDTIGISTNGIARMLINSSGNVGIGTTTPGSALTVAGNGLFSGNITSTGQMFATASTSNSLPAFAIAGDSDTGFTYTNNSFRLIKDGTATFAIDTLIGFVAPFYRISGVSGTAANASYGHISSAGTGMFFPSIGSLSLTTAGVERLRINDLGNVGIGTTTPVARLAVTGTAGTDDVFMVASSTNAGMLVVKSDGNVGIGTMSPSSRLSILSTSEQFRSGFDGLNYMTLTTGSTGINTFDAFGASASFNFADTVRVQNSNPTFQLDNLTPNASTAGTLQFRAGGGAEVFSQSLDATANIFSMAYGSSVGVSINSAGSVGIGTSTISSALTVGSGQISAPAGSATAPSYTFNGDTNTGIYSTYSDGLEFTTGGTRRFFIDNGAIGSTNTTFAGPSGTASNPGFRFFLDGDNGMFNPTTNQLALSTAGVERFRINDVGNVGIGTTTAPALLTVGGNAVIGGSSGALTTSLDVVNNSLNNAALAAMNVTSGSSVASVGARSSSFGFHDTANAGIFSATGRLVINSGSSALNGVTTDDISFRTGGFGSSQEKVRITNVGNVGIGTSSPAARLAVTGLAGTDDVFSVASSTNTNMFVVKSSGNVGIGITAPDKKMHIGENVAAVSFALKLSNENSVTGNGTGILFGINASANTNRGKGGLVYVNEPSSTWNIGDFHFLQSTSLNSAQPTLADAVFTIKNNGNVGIGTTTPSTRLAVAGGVNITGALQFNGNAGTSGFVLQSTGTSAQWVATSSLGIGGSIDLDALSVIEVGNSNTTTGTGAIAFGSSNTSSGTNSTAIGQSSTASALRTVAIGWGSEATADYAVAIGEDNNALSSSAVAIGWRNNATSSAGAVAIGGLNSSSGNFSSAVGTWNTAQGSGSGAFGDHLTVTAGGAFAFGRFITNNITDSVMIGPSDTAKITILSSGNVGIGTTTPAARLAVTAAPGTGDLLVLASSTNARALTVNFLGNIGIGTASPLSGLHTYGNLSGAVEAFRTENASNGANAHSIFRFINDGGVGAQAGFFFNSSNRTTDAGSNGFGFYNDAINGNLAFRTRGDIFFSTSFPVTERLRITTGGNVGIGTSVFTGGVLPGAGTNRFIVSGTGGSGMVINDTTGFANFSALGAAEGNFSIGDTGATSGSRIWNFNANDGVLSIRRLSDLQTGVLSTPLTILASGNIGIGTTTPGASLVVTDDGADVGDIIRLQSTSASKWSSIGFFDNLGTQKGSFGYGNASASSYASTVVFQASTGVPLAFGTNGSEKLRIDTSGNVGIGTTTPTAQLHTTGTVRFSTFTAGTLTTDADGNVTASSDERLKDIEGDFSRGLEDLRRIQPITYKWRTSSGLDTDSSYSGFSAQNVQLAIPEAVASRPGGFLSLSDRPILAAAINAIKELADKIDAITAWFRDGKLDVQNDICVDDVCVTKDQFKAILRNAGGNQGVETDQSGGGSDTDGGTQDQSGDVPAGDPDPEPTGGGEEPAPTDNQTEADGGGATDSSGEGQNEPAGDSQTDSTSSDGGSNSDSGGSEGDSSGGEGASV